MSTLLLSLILWLQVPIQANQSGTISGILKDSQGKPVAGVRIAAIAPPQSVDDAVSSAAMSSIAETDSQGRYTLEGVPPGRYYVSAGRLDFPTYYPGTQAMGSGTLITVAAGLSIPGIDFALKDSSAGRADAGNFAFAAPALSIPLDVRTEDGVKKPLFAEGQFTSLRITTGGATPLVVPLNQPFVSLPAAAASYQIAVDGLPTGYSVKSMKYGSDELAGGVLTLGTANLLAARGLLAAVPQLLTVVLTRAAATRPAGVNVTGKLVNSANKAVYLSGVSGVVYADGTYEIPGVAPGQHTLVVIDRQTSRAQAASFILGARDVSDLPLRDTPMLPVNVKTPVPPKPVGSRSPGPLALASVRGRLLDIENGGVVTQGTIFIVGDSWAGHSIESDGKFEFQGLLPGSYQLEVQAVGYPAFRSSVTLETEDLDLELKVN